MQVPLNILLFLELFYSHFLSFFPQHIILGSQTYMDALITLSFLDHHNQYEFEQFVSRNIF